MKSIQPTIAAGDIEDFVSTTEAVIDDAPQMNESNTKVKVIQPFLEDVLQWDIHHMELEYSIQMGGQAHHVDYSLQVSDIPEVFVEAKGCDKSLQEKHVNQLRSYLKMQDVSWGLLTNGKEYRLYQLTVEDGSTEFHSIAKPSLSDLPSHREALSAISKPAIEGGNAADVVRYIRELNRAEEALETRKGEISEAVAETVTEETTDVIYQEAEQAAKELVDGLVDTLQTDNSSVVRGSGPTETPPEESPTEIDPEDADFSVISLSEVEGESDAHVAVYPSNTDGIEFLQKHLAWGFISIAQQPDYFLIYLTAPFGHIRYLGVVDDIVPADEFIANNDIPQEKHKYDEGKKVVSFSDLYELETPIPLGDESPYRMQGLLYTTLGNVKSAATTDDL